MIMEDDGAIILSPRLQTPELTHLDPTTQMEVLDRFSQLDAEKLKEIEEDDVEFAQVLLLTLKELRFGICDNCNQFIAYGQDFLQSMDEYWYHDDDQDEKEEMKIYDMFSGRAINHPPKRYKNQIQICLTCQPGFETTYVNHSFRWQRMHAIPSS